MRLAVFAILAGALLLAAQSTPPPTPEKTWQTPTELLSWLAQRDGLSWAMPEGLAGRAFVGDGTTKTLLDDACKQWGLAWFESNGIHVLHLPGDARLKAASDKLAPETSWELGWLRDARALPLVSQALTSTDAALALAAAHSIDRLAREIPLGRDERVEAAPPGRVSLARAFPLPADIEKAANSPYPAIRAAALRLVVAHGGERAKAVLARSEKDSSQAVQRVRQQATFVAGPKKPPGKWDALRPLPKDPAEVQAACEKMVAELPGLEKQSQWEEMQHRARILAAWARAGSEPATETLIALTTTKHQQGWYPGYVQKELASVGSEKARRHLLDLMPKANRAMLVRGLEESHFGADLFAYLRPHLAEQTIAYVAARKAGIEALDDLLALAEKNNYAAIDAVGAIGGPNTVPVLAKVLHRDEANSQTLAFRAARALGQVGSPEAAEALLEASRSESRQRRHAATLFLGHIGGPKVMARLHELMEKETDRLVLTAAADALEQLTGPLPTATQAFRKADAALPVLKYQPRNPRFGEDFPVNEWVNLKIRIGAFAEFGEMGWNYDAANRLFFRYGGCSGYTNELTVFDLGTEQFVQRRPNEEMAGWGDRRPPRGCSAGRCWDPYQKVAWIGPAIGGSDSDLAIAEYYNRDGGHRFDSYDLATDRFRPAPLRQATYGEPAKRYAYDWKHGLMYPVKFQHPEYKTKDWWAFDTKSGDPYKETAWLQKTNPAGDYPRHSGYTIGAVDQDTGLLVVYVPAFDSRPPETWTYDPEKNRWQNRQPKVQPQAQAGAGFAYDPFHKVLLLQGGKKEYQYGGPKDSLTWTYDVRTNTWTDLEAKNGPGNPWVGALDFDPEHNVFVVFNARDRSVWAYRYRAVER